MSDDKPPLVSIILPAYNCEKYLREAIDSILQQTFTNFEFIIINDGSSDATEKITLSYIDPRIIYLKNDTNKGLIYTLNRGLSKAKGKYIARMDGDDISLPERLKKQYDWLEGNKTVDVLATQVSLIDENDKDIGFWEDDIKHSTANSIKKYLPVNNCIAHPTILGKKEAFLKYKYNPSQKLSEDYDLWLRMTADGLTIDKLAQPLLKHRILQSSFTRTRNVNVFYKVAVVKWNFVKNSLARGKFNSFIFSAFLYSIFDRIKGTGKVIKKLVIKH
ncbi:MAG: glycosyltransferase family 2 protein [Segetibacter sp.]